MFRAEKKLEERPQNKTQSKVNEKIFVVLINYIELLCNTKFNMKFPKQNKEERSS